jgi:glycosyltransferase involved in cell wall biosynthesis
VHGHSVGGTNPALLQALGAGAPTLALDTVFNAEVLPYTAQRFTQDVQALAEKIRTVLSSTALQEEMSQHGRSVVRERYAWDDVCQKYMNVLLTLAANR